MRLESRIEDALVEYLSDVLKQIDNLKIIRSGQFSELQERSQNMVVVGLSNRQNVNPGLKDYMFKLNIVVNTFIADDLECDFFDDITEIIDNELNKFVTKQVGLDQLFKLIPVVGMVYNSTDFSEDGQSHIANFQYNIWTSQ